MAVYPNNCGVAPNANASGLPQGFNFNNSQAVISGTPTNQASGTYNYTITASINTTSTSFTGAVSGTIIVTIPPVNSNIYFENGTCKCPNASVGDTAVINGTIYRS